MGLTSSLPPLLLCGSIHTAGHMSSASHFPSCTIVFVSHLRAHASSSRPQSGVTYRLSTPLQSYIAWILGENVAVPEAVVDAILLAAVSLLVRSLIDYQHSLEIRLGFRFGCEFDSGSWLFPALGSAVPCRWP